MAGLCAERHIAHATLRIDLKAGPGVSERARDARYAALGDWAARRGLAALVTAHHADDQAETLVMRLNRGAGVRGLAAMRAVATVPGHPGLPLLRPLLDVRRDDLAALVTQAGIVAVEDPSNRDPRFERARVRAGMAQAAWLDRAALARSAAHLAEADAVIDWATQRSAAAIVRGDSEWTWVPDAPRAVRLRVLEAICTGLGSNAPRGAELARWLDRLETGGVATLAGVKGDGRATPWRFAAVPPHRM